MELQYQHSAGIDQDDIQAHTQALDEYAKKLRAASQDADYTSPESSLYVPFDTKLFTHARDAANTLVTPALKYIFVIGIGGSNLGTKALYDAFYGYFDLFEQDRFPKMIFLDTCDPAQLAISADLLDTLRDTPEAFAIILISKTGNTTESLFNFEALGMSVPFDVLQKRLVTITMEDTKLWHHAEENGIHVISVPEVVGGRYSVFTPVGTLPLVCGGIDVEALLKGARDVTTQYLNTDGQKDTARLTAAIMYEHLLQGISIHDLFFFHPELESLGKWYRQLLAESLGKDSTGILPTVTIGSTDLHSIVQLYIGGPHNRLTTFVSPKESHPQDIVLGSQLLLPNIVDEIKNRSASEVMWAIYEAVKREYNNNGLPFVEVRLEDLSAYELGQYMQYQMLVTMYLGQLMGVNAFDQPNVEKYKVETKRILKG